MASKTIMVAKRGSSSSGAGAGFGAAFGQEAYTEMQEVSVDDKVRVFSFHEDMRPAYVGTYSKRSTFITGRKPFGQDHKQLNYDYDSEEEWEEQEEGEDIADSAGEEEEGGNDLEYDDFFRRDNDYGSDVDSDGEGVAAAIVQRRDGEERIGPRFLRRGAATAAGDDTPPQHVSLRFCFESGTFIDCLEKEKDVQRLRSYPAVAFSYAAITTTPTLGVSSGAVKKGGGHGKSKRESDDASVMSDDQGGAGLSKPAKVPREKKPPREPRLAFDETCMPDLIAHVHGKTEGAERLVAQFHEQHPNLVKVRKCPPRKFNLALLTKPRQLPNQHPPTPLPPPPTPSPPPPPFPPPPNLKTPPPPTNESNSLASTGY